MGIGNTVRTVMSVMGMMCLLFACDVSRFVEDGDEEGSGEADTATIELTEFVYSGSGGVHKAYLALYGSDGSSGSTVATHSKEIKQTGIQDITIKDIPIPDRDEYRQWVLLHIASDEDDSGDLTTGDFILPVARFKMDYGETVQIDGLHLDANPGSMPVAAAPKTDLTFYVAIDYGELDTVDPSQPLVLRVDWVDGDFTADTGTLDAGIAGPASDLVYQVPLAQAGLYEELIFYSVPDPPSDTSFFFLMYHDQNNNGAPDSGEPASETDLTVISNSTSVTSGETGDRYINISIDKNTVIP